MSGARHPRGARATTALLVALGALAACCPPGVATSTTGDAYAGSLSATEIEAGRGYGFALLGQASPGGADREAPDTASDADADTASSPAAGGSPEGERAAFAARFESAWGLVAERYWDLDSLAVDWDEVGRRYRAELDDVDGEAALYALLEAMYDELGDNHSVFVPPYRVAEIRESYGDLPCVAVFDSAASRLPSALGAARAQAPQAIASAAAGPVQYGMTTAGSLDVGYIRLADLASEGTAGGLREAVSRLTASAADALILDLRGNPGGRLVTMMQAAGVFTRGFLWRAVMSWTLPLPYPAIGEPVTQLPLVVLVDGGVNSAAEGLAGALQAQDRAYLIGETTAGNVEAVLPFCLRDGSQAWIATGVLAPLLGATWEGRGVVPDLAVPGQEALERAIEYLSSSEVPDPNGAGAAGD